MDNELLASLNDIWFVSMPMFNISAVSGAPKEVQDVYNQLTVSGSTIQDVISGIYDEGNSVAYTPEKIFPILKQLEQMGLISRIGGVSGFRGMLITNSANNLFNSESLSISLFNPVRVSPILDSSKAIADMGFAEDNNLVAQSQIDKTMGVSDGTIDKT